MTPALSLEDVYLTLPAASGPVEILKGVSFRAMPGESVAIVGPSGSGKSSLIGVSTGIERATRGAISLLGDSIDITKHRLVEAGTRRSRRGMCRGGQEISQQQKQGKKCGLVSKQSE